MAKIPPDRLEYMIAHIDDKRNPGIRSIYYLNTVLVLVSTALRFYVRVKKRAGLRWDDWTILVAALASLGVSICAFLQMGFGMGRHIIALSPENLQSILKAIYTFAICYSVSISMIKISILFFYQRIFSLSWFGRLTKASLIFMAVYGTAFTLVFIFNCNPIHFFWNRQLPGGKCINSSRFLYTSTAFQIFTDFWIFLLPVPMILKLQIPLGRRIGLCFIFMIGLGVSIIAIIRMFHIWRYTDIDITWNTIELGLLVQLETLGGVLAANLPVIYPLFTEAYTAIKTHSSGSLSYTAGSSNKQSTGKSYSQGSTRKGGPYSTDDMELGTSSCERIVVTDDLKK